MSILDLSVLDLGDPLSTPLLATRAEELGFSSYWLGQHYGSPTQSASPTILAAIVAGLTTTLQVGSAGVLLGFQAPYQVASDFQLLERLFPGRVRLGVCRGKPTSPEIMDALLDGRDTTRTASFRQKVETICRWFRDSRVGDAPTCPGPDAATSPPLWVFGTGYESATIAATLGVSYGFSYYQNPSPEALKIVRTYVDNFVPSGGISSPEFLIAVSGICASSTGDADELLSRHSVLPPRATFVGDPDTVRRHLEVVSERFECRHLVLFNPTLNVEVGLTTLRYISDVFELPRRPVEGHTVAFADM